MNQELNKEACKEYVETRVNTVLGPLLVDLIKNQPDDILDYVIEWCQTKGPQYSGPSQPSRIMKENVTGPYMLKKVARPMGFNGPIAENLKKDSVLYSQEINEQAAFEQKIMEKIKNRKKKNGISAEVYGEFHKMGDFKPPVVQKDAHTAVKIREVVARSFMFDSLDDAEIQVVIAAMSIRVFKAGDAVIKQGDSGDELFIVSEGVLKCCKRFGGKEEIYLRNYESGQVFGELSLFYNTPRAASIYAVTDSSCFSLDRETFSQIVKRSAIEKRARVEESLCKVEILKGLKDIEIIKLGDCLQTEKYVKDDYIVKEGEQGNKMYFIQQGAAVALKMNTKGQEQIVYEFKENDYFGEIAIIEKDKRKASIKVTSDSAIVLSLTRDSFNRVLSDTKTLFKNRINRYKNYKSK